LFQFLNAISDIGKKFIFRIHTRAPIVNPSRINSNLLSLFSKCFPQIVLVLHINSPEELSQEVEAAILKLKKTGAILLSQSVLLRGINDSVHILEKLFLKLYSLGVKPYYLHQLDKSPGTAHFEVKTKVGIELMKKLRENLPGPAVPLYVQDGEEILYKTPLF
jgi:KamA family protein